LFRALSLALLLVGCVHNVPKCAAASCTLDARLMVGTATTIKNSDIAKEHSVEPLKFDGELDAAMGDRLYSGIQAARKAKVHEFTILIDSPGGRVDWMFYIYDALRAAEHEGVKSRCVVLPDGYAASAAAFILEGCTTRVMAPSSRLLFHEVASGANGKKGDLRRTTHQLEDADMHVAVILAPRLHMTAAAFYAWVNGRDRWLDASAALEHFAVDSVE
jgi:ATP-dependent protease ClpP protease subunit